MIMDYRNFSRLIFAVLISLIMLTGCEKKEEKNPEVQKTNASTVDTSAKAKEMKKDTVVIPDLTGNWTGIFDKRSATMSVIKQTGRDFSALMNINYRQPLTKTVNGTIDPDNKTVKMEDLNESRFPGKYTAQLSDDGKQIKGNFILRTNGESYGFNFKMK
jgi:hypothetical protein